MTVPFDDRGLLLGDGLFETLLVVDGRPVRLEAHAARMQAGAGVLGLPPPTMQAFAATAAEAVEAAGLAAVRAAVRVTLTAGSGGRGLDRPDPPAPRLFAAAAPSPRVEAPLTAAIAEVRRNDRSPISRLKSLAYLDNILARRQARALGADEAVMLNTGGVLACAAAANLFWIVGDRLFTPAPECGVLAGIMRGAVLERAADCGLVAAEVHAGPEALDAADAVFLTNSLAGVRLVSRIGSRAFEPSGAVARLKAALADLA